MGTVQNRVGCGTDAGEAETRVQAKNRSRSRGALATQYAAPSIGHCSSQLRKLRYSDPIRSAGPPVPCVLVVIMKDSVTDQFSYNRHSIVEGGNYLVIRKPPDVLRA